MLRNMRWRRMTVAEDDVEDGRCARSDDVEDDDVEDDEVEPLDEEFTG